MELFCVYRYHVLFIIDNLRSAISPVMLFLFVFLLVQVGSDSVQGAGAPTMFQAMRRVVECLAHEYVGEGGFERAIRQSFLGIVPWKLYRSITKIMLLLDTWIIRPGNCLCGRTCMDAIHLHHPCFSIMRCIVKCLCHEYVHEGGYEPAMNMYSSRCKLLLVYTKVMSLLLRMIFFPHF